MSPAEVLRNDQESKLGTTFKRMRLLLSRNNKDNLDHELHFQAEFDYWNKKKLASEAKVRPKKKLRPFDDKYVCYFNFTFILIIT